MLGSGLRVSRSEGQGKHVEKVECSARSPFLFWCASWGWAVKVGGNWVVGSVRLPPQGARATVLDAGAGLDLASSGFDPHFRCPDFWGFRYVSGSSECLD